MTTTMKYFIFICSIFVFSYLNAQNHYMIPDIGTPGMNTYIEIIAPHDQKNYFGADGLYLNTTTSTERLTVTAGWEDLVIISPFVVSWEGRMISAQIFVSPQLEAKHWDWEQNVDAVMISYSSSTINYDIDQFYIVKPFPFGDQSSNNEKVIGEKTSQLGKRSPRGAMIVDEMILGDLEYKVSTDDCDPNTPGNQGYLPFILLSKGNVQGSGSNTEINVSANGREGGPGGGGGAGKWVDFLGGGQTDGGNGFSGGGPGGKNTPPGRETPGEGSGSINVDATTGGSSINGVNGGNSSIAYESAGGGTGHPFGKSANGANTGPNCTSCFGEYGAGAGVSDNLMGGGAGYGSDASGGASSSRGFLHGNKMGIPFAGGSGAGGGNPNGFINTSGGAGGGGGGAIRIFANKISELTINSNGGNGENVSGTADGGGGSGGMIEIGSKEVISNVSLSVDGGKTGGTMTGGYGRMRYDVNPSSLPNVPVGAFTQFNGIITDNSSSVTKLYSLNGTFANSLPHVYLKSKNMEWTKLSNVAEAGQNWSVDLDMSNGDEEFYLMAIEPATEVIEEYKSVPQFVFSQAAANIFTIVQNVDYDDISERNLIKPSCGNDYVYDTLELTSTGTEDLIAEFDNATWEFNDFNDRGYELFEPTDRETITPNQNIDVIVRFQKQVGQLGTVFNNNLIIPNNANDPSKDPLTISYTTNESDAIKISFYETDDIGFTTPLDVLDLGDYCIPGTDEFIQKSFVMVNESSYEINVDSYNTSTTSSTMTMDNSTPLGIDPSNNSRLIDIYYKSIDDTEEIEFSNVTFDLRECPGVPFEKSVRVNKFDFHFKKVSSIQDFGKVQVGTTKNLVIEYRNDGDRPISIVNNGIRLQNSTDFQILDIQPPLPVVLNKNDNIVITVEFAPTEAKIYKQPKLKFEVQIIDEINGCEQNNFFSIDAEGVDSQIFYDNPTDYGTFLLCEGGSSQTFTLFNSNNATSDLNISPSQPTITGDNVFFSLDNPNQHTGTAIPPGEKVEYDVYLDIGNNGIGKKSATLTIPTDFEDVVVELLAEVEDLKISSNPTVVDFGDIPIKIKQAQKTVTLNNNSNYFDWSLITLSSADPFDYDKPLRNDLLLTNTSSTIGVGLTLDTPGPFSGTVSCAFRENGDINCTRTFSLPVIANGVLAETTISPLASTIDYGIFNKCEAYDMAGQQIMIENSSLTNITSTTFMGATISGTDANLFNIIDNNIVKLGQNAVKTLNIQFNKDQNELTYGRKNATVNIDVMENGNIVKYTKYLTAEVAKGLVSLNPTIDFGQVVISLSSENSASFSNTFSWNISAADIGDAISFPTIFNANDNFDFQLIPNGSEPTLSLSFTPMAEQIYNDQIIIPYQINNICDEELTLDLVGEGIAGSSIALHIPDQLLDPRNNFDSIPIMGQITNGIELNDIKINLELTLNKNSFLPNSVSNGNITKHEITGDNLKLFISLDGVNVGTEESSISSIHGTTLLGNTKISDIIVENVEVTPLGLVSQTNLPLDNAKLELVICSLGGDRLIEANDPIKLDLPSQIINTNSIINVNVLESGTHKLSLIDILGNKIELKEWKHSINSSTIYTQLLDVNNLNSGVYMLHLETPNRTKQLKFIINK